MPSRIENLEKVRDRAIEVGLYLPLGAYSVVRDELVDFDAKRLRKAFDGLIDRGQSRLQPVEKAVRSRTRRFGSKAAETATSTRKTARSTATKAVKKARVAATEVAPKLPRVAAPKKASELPIANYGSLTAGEITSRLRGLTQTDLARVYKFERAHENRSTILEAVESRLVDLPIPTYDALTVDEVVDRLPRLSEQELKAIRRYESDTKDRSTIIEKIEALLAA